VRARNEIFLHRSRCGSFATRSGLQAAHTAVDLRGHPLGIVHRDVSRIRYSRTGSEESGASGCGGKAAAARDVSVGKIFPLTIPDSVSVDFGIAQAAAHLTSRRPKPSRKDKWRRPRRPLRRPARPLHQNPYGASP
jgi:hypothetical protein